MPQPLFSPAAWMLALVCFASPPARAAEPPPVLPGLWDIRLLVTFELLPAASLNGVFAAAEGPQARRYRICLTPARARAPMAQPRLPPAAEVVFDRQTVSGYYAETDADGHSRNVEFAYRRLDPDAFEGSQDVESGGQARRLQYDAHRVGPDCGAMRASPVAPTGEP